MAVTNTTKQTKYYVKTSSQHTEQITVRADKYFTPILGAEEYGLDILKLQETIKMMVVSGGRNERV